MFDPKKSMIAIALSIILTAAPLTVRATQITPNPNPAGSTIDIINDPSAVNNDALFDNEGIINIDPSSTLTNSVEAYLNNTGAAAELNNAGSLDNYGGLGNLYGASLTNADGGTLNNYGNLSNSLPGATLTNAGTLNNYAGATLCNCGGPLGSGGLTNTGTLNNFAGAMWYNGDAAPVFNADGGTLNNYGMMHTDAARFYNNGTIYNFGSWDTYITTVNNFAGGTLNNYGGIRALAGSSVENAGTLNNFGGGTLTFVTLSNTGTLTNAGTLTKQTDISGGYASIGNSGILNNTGSIVLSRYGQSSGQTINNGTITADSVDIQGGSLRGTGVITGDVTLDSGALLAPGDATTLGTFTINGNLQSSGSLRFRFDGLDLGEFDVLNIQGDAMFTGGTIGFDFLDYTPTAGNSWDFLYADSITGWDTLDFDFYGLGPDLTYAFNYSNGVETLSLHSVPEPSTLLLLGSGFVMLLAISRKTLARADLKEPILSPAEYRNLA